MATPVKLQRLSKFADQSEVLEWLKAPGDAIRAGEALLTVLSDKATVEIAAPVSGVLLNIAVSAGAEVPAGTVLAWIGEPGEIFDEVERAAGPHPERQAGPSNAGRDTTVEAEPAPPIGSKVRAVPAARRLAAEMGVALETLTGSGPGGIVTALDVERAAQRRAQPAVAGSHKISPTGHPRITPVARRFAQEHGLDIDQIAGSGPGGEIVKADVERLLQSRRATTSDASTGQEERTVLPLQGFMRSMAQRMTASHQVVVQATTVADVDMTEIVHLRAHIPASYTAFVIKAASRAVAEFPLINASLEEKSIVLKKHVDMGVAVATDAGLVVPVLRHAEERSLAEIHRALESLSNRARDQALGIEELGSPSMTVTNSGVFGSLLFTPIIVAPQSATLGMGKVMPTVVVRENQMVIREIMYLCLSYDHRIIDGSVAVRYLQRIKAYLEEPLPLLWDEDAS